MKRNHYINTFLSSIIFLILSGTVYAAEAEPYVEGFQDVVSSSSDDDC